jgi:transposase
MRGKPVRQVSMLTTTTPDDLVPQDHPIRRIKPVVEDVLRSMGPTFDAMYASNGRVSVPPEHLLKATVLMALFTIRSERQFCEQLRFNLLFKWFLDLNTEDPGFDHSTFSKNRRRLLQHEVADQFFAAVVEHARLNRYVSDDHFTVDGTLLEAWASIKSFKPNDGDGGGPDAGGGRNPEVDFHGQKRSNATHRSSTDPEARLARKGSGKEAKLSYAGHALMENRNGLLVDLELTEANGYAEREAALLMLRRQRRRGRRGRRTVGADKAYDTRDFRDGCREQKITPHVAQDTSNGRRSIDGRTTRHHGYAISQRIRKRVEEIFGWTKTVGGGRKLRFRGRERNRSWLLFTGAAYNLVRIGNLAKAT